METEEVEASEPGVARFVGVFGVGVEVLEEGGGEEVDSGAGVCYVEVAEEGGEDDCGAEEVGAEGGEDGGVDWDCGLIVERALDGGSGKRMWWSCGV